MGGCDVQLHKMFPRTFHSAPQRLLRAPLPLAPSSPRWRNGAGGGGAPPPQAGCAMPCHAAPHRQAWKFPKRRLARIRFPRAPPQRKRPARPDPAVFNRRHSGSHALLTPRASKPAARFLLLLLLRGRKLLRARLG